MSVICLEEQKFPPSPLSSLPSPRGEGEEGEGRGERGGTVEQGFQQDRGRGPCRHRQGAAGSGARVLDCGVDDPEYEDALDKVNVVIHPVTNPDGAQLAYDLYQITPDHMLHAGYLGSLGVDVLSGQGDDDPIYPEAKVRPKL